MPRIELVTPAAYARHRGCSRAAVSKAVADGRISTVDGLIDPVVADIQWRENTRARAGSDAPPATQQPAWLAGAAGQVAPELPLSVGTEAPATQWAEGGEATGPVRNEAYAESRTRREKAEAEMAELKLQEQLGQVVKADVVRTAYAKHVSAVRDALLLLPGRLAPMLATEIDPTRIQTQLDQELRQVLQLFGDRKE